MDHEHLAEQVRTLRERAEADANGAGLEALRVMEDLFYDEARVRGFRNEHGGLGEYSDFLKARDFLSPEQHARARRYADVRNCVAHRGGLLLGPALVEEILDFLATLTKRGAVTAGQLMTRQLRTVAPEDGLLEARDWMLRKGVSQLPVLKDGRIAGLLTNRDLLAVEAESHGKGRNAAGLRVADAVDADSAERITFVRPDAAYDDVLDALRRNHSAVLVTERGDASGALLGIITVSDLLPKL